MNKSDKPELRTMDESVFYQLLDRHGVVQIGIVKVENFFAPFVTFCASDGLACIEYGAIVRGKSDLLAAKTVRDLVDLIHDLAHGSKVSVILPKELDYREEATH